METKLGKEIENVQNPALGGYLLSVFAKAYCEQGGEFPPLQLLFVVYPLLYLRDIFDVIASTNTPTGLQSCMNKLMEKKSLKNDLVFDIQPMIISRKIIILECIKLAMISGMMVIGEDGLVIALTETIKKVKIKDKNIEKMNRVAEKMGIWFSRLTMTEISYILKVRF